MFPDGKPMLRQGDTGDWIGTFEGHKGAVWGVALNPEATRAATGAADFNAKVWDAIKGEEIHSFQHNHIVKSVNFSTDSNYLCTGSNEKIVRIYDLNKPETAPQVRLHNLIIMWYAKLLALKIYMGDNKIFLFLSQIFSGHTSGIRHITFFDNNSALITCADDKTLRVWDRNSGQEVKRLDFPAIPSSMEVSKDGNIITTTHSNIVTFWNSKEYVHFSFFIVLFIIKITVLTYGHSKSCSLYANNKKNSLQFLFVIRLTKIKEFTVPTQVNSASLHPDCTMFVCGGEDLKMYKFDYNTGAELGWISCLL